MTQPPIRKGTLVWLPDGRAGRITECDREKNVLTYGPLPWYTRVIRTLLGRPNRRGATGTFVIGGDDVPFH